MKWIFKGKCRICINCEESEEGCYENEHGRCKMREDRKRSGIDEIDNRENDKKFDDINGRGVRVWDINNGNV